MLLRQSDPSEDFNFTLRSVLQGYWKRLGTAIGGLYRGRSIAQVVSLRLPTSAARIRSQFVMWDLW
jgi:hypothetical protein